MAQFLPSRVSLASSRLSSFITRLQHITRQQSLSSITAVSWTMADWGVNLRIPIKGEDGGTEVVEVFVSQYRKGTGPVYLQTSYDPFATPDSASFQSLSLGLTLSCAELPLSSASALIRLDPDDLTAVERRSLESQIAQKVHEITSSPVSITRDLPLLDYAKAVGTWTVMSNLCGLTMKSERKTAVFGSFSPRQAQTMSLLRLGNVVPIAVSDNSRGGTINESGLDITQLSHHYETHRTVKGFDGGVSFHRQFPALAPDILISEEPTSGLFPQAKIVVETESSLLDVADDRLRTAAGATVIPAVVSNIGEAVAAFAHCASGSRGIPKGLYKQWTTWLGVKQIESLEALRKTQPGSGVMRDRLRAAVENVAAATAFRVAWRQKKTGESLREACLAGAVGYDAGKRSV